MIEFSHHPTIIEPFVGHDDRLCISNTPIADLAAEYTEPFYVYSRERIATQLDQLRSATPAILDIHFAVKSNPFRPFLKAVEPLVDGFDIASIGELQLLQEAGCHTHNVSFAGPGKSENEICQAIKQGVKIIVESPHQLDMCQRMAQTLGLRACVMVRLNDQKQRSGGGLSMSGNQNGFGWDSNDFNARGNALFTQASHVDFHGFHVFFGSQILKPDAIAKSIQASIETIIALPTPTLPKLINLGGGLGVPYAPHDVPLDLSKLTPVWQAACDTLKKRYPEVKVCIELGRFIAAPTGLYITRIVDKKKIGDQLFVVCNGGLHHFSAATGNFGQALKRNHPVYPAVPRAPLETVTLIGALCTPMDVFARNVALPRMEIGDSVVMFQAGAYGFSASPRGFLSHPEPHQRLI